MFVIEVALFELAVCFLVFKIIVDS